MVSKKRIVGLIVFLLALSVGVAPAQQDVGSTAVRLWDYQYTGPLSDRTYAMVLDGTGNVYLSGYETTAATGKDAILLLLDPDGNELFSVSYAGAGAEEDFFNAVGVAGSGYFGAAGRLYVSSANNHDTLTVLYDEQNNSLWDGYYNGAYSLVDQIEDMAFDAEGNVYVTGYAYCPNAKRDMVTLKYAPAGGGTPEWTAVYDSGYGNDDRGVAIGLDDSGNIYVAGLTWNTMEDYVVVKYDTDGNQLWASLYDGPADNSDIPTRMVVDGEGNSFVTGRATASIYDTVNNDFATVAFDADGNQLWNATYTYANTDTAYAIALDQEGNVYVGGSASGNGCLIKYDPDGNQLWADRRIHSSNYRDVAVDEYGNVFGVGYMWFTGTGRDITLFAYDTDGAFLYKVSYSGSANLDEEGYEVETDAEGHVVVGGYAANTGTGEDIVAIKYCGGCYIDGACYSHGAVNPDNVCQICDNTQDAESWSDNDGVTCDDGLWCTVDDVCADQVCGGADRDCDDDLFCSGVETCDEENDQCVSPGDPCPDDGLYCTGTESCDEDNDQCVASGDPCEDDGLFCTGVESCDEENDQCASAGDPCEDDGLYCTGTESCDEDNDQCVSSGDPCEDDGLFCTGVESCDEDNDQCASAGDPCEDDGLYCTGTESCDEDNDQCVASGDPCEDDGLFCTGVESCDEDNDQCISAGDPCEDDGLYCTGTESCDEENDQCASSGDPCAEDETCNDETDSCDPLTDDDDDATDDDAVDDDDDKIDDDDDDDDDDAQDDDDSGATTDQGDDDDDSSSSACCG